MDEIVLSFDDSLLHQSDLDILAGPGWLNDKIIGFAFEYFEKVAFAELENKVAFIHPSVVQLVKMVTAEEAAVVLQSANLASKQILFVPVNDNESLLPGGSHWSLVVYDVNEHVFYHFDSSNTAAYNEECAKALCQKLAPMLGFKNCNFTPAAGPVQANSYDCGMYVIATTEILCKCYSETGKFAPDIDLLKNVTPNVITQERKKLSDLILQLAKDQCEHKA